MPILTKNKKSFIILAGAMSLFLFSGAAVLAAEPIVPCGREGTPACTLCHLFLMLQRIINIFLNTIVPALAILLIVYSGFQFITARGDANSENVKRAKAALTAAVIGLVIIYGSYIAINEFLKALGADISWGPVGSWYQVNCP